MSTIALDTTFDSATAPPASTTITVARGDGIGPEIMDAALKVLDAAGARLDLEEIQIGESVYKQGHTAGIAQEAWDSLRRTRVLLKGPITTPQGGGYKSLNVTIRKTLGLFANVRPCTSYHPFVATRHPGMDVIIVRENEEDTYAGIEHRQTDEVYQCLKLISRPGSERIVRYAFEHARAQGRKRVSCFTKDNIMKMTDGLFHRVFDEVAAEYSDIETDHWIIDIGAAMLADRPEQFDVIVTENLYGDIISDIAAQVAGSVGLAGSANIGPSFSMFEAIHGSAPKIAGQGIANPSGLLHASLLMLVHLGQGDVAERIHNAWLKTIEEGIHTFDIYHRPNSHRQASTGQFADAIVSRMGELPTQLKSVRYGGATTMKLPPWNPPVAARKELVGVDIFLHARDATADELANRLQAAALPELQLKMITNRGVKVWPQGMPETVCTDHWRCRFRHPAGEAIPPRLVAQLYASVLQHGMEPIKTENLYYFDDKPGFSLGQGE
jgi:isocitrate dehydrogenase